MSATLYGAAPHYPWWPPPSWPQPSETDPLPARFTFQPLPLPASAADGAPPDRANWRKLKPLTPEQIAAFTAGESVVLTGEYADEASDASAPTMFPDVNVVPAYGMVSPAPSERFPAPAPTPLPANALVQGAITRLVELRLSNLDPAAMRAEIDAVIGALTIAVSLLEAK